MQLFLNNIFDFVILIIETTEKVLTITSILGVQMKVDTYNIVLLISLIYLVLMHFGFSVVGDSQDTAKPIIKIQGLVKTKKQ